MRMEETSFWLLLFKGFKSHKTHSWWQVYRFQENWSTVGLFEIDKNAWPPTELRTEGCVLCSIPDSSVWWRPLFQSWEECKEGCSGHDGRKTELGAQTSRFSTCLWLAALSWVSGSFSPLWSPVSYLKMSICLNT